MSVIIVKLTNVHKSAAVSKMLLDNSQWFSPDHNAIAGFYKDFIKNKKEWNKRAKRQGYQSRSKFSFDKMKELLGKLLDNYVKDIPKNVALNLPKLEKVSPKKEMPTLKLPTLKKV